GGGVRVRRGGVEWGCGRSARGRRAAAPGRREQARVTGAGPRLVVAGGGGGGGGWLALPRRSVYRGATAAVAHSADMAPLTHFCNYLCTLHLHLLLGKVASSSAGKRATVPHKALASPQMMLALATCLVGVAQAAAVKSKLPITHPDHPDRPKPIQPAEDCDVKRLPCVPVYTEEGARRLADLGIMEQVVLAVLALLAAVALAAEAGGPELSYGHGGAEGHEGTPLGRPDDGSHGLPLAAGGHYGQSTQTKA
ncbi:Protein of unknown function, partial [Gryllus bimaculatus]